MLAATFLVKKPSQSVIVVSLEELYLDKKTQLNYIERCPINHNSYNLSGLIRIVKLVSRHLLKADFKR